MKRCPECRRDYLDDSLLYCLDDGTALLEGPGAAIASSEQRTLSFEKATTLPATESSRSSNAKKSKDRLLIFVTVVAAIVVVTVAAGYFLYHRTPELAGSFREPGSPAYDYYVRGKLDSDAENEERNANAIKVLENVVKRDSTFAPAYAELARAYSIRANDWAPDDEKARLFDDARLAAEKSLLLDPNLAEGHVVRAFVMWTTAGRFPHEQAILSLKKAVEIDPNLAAAHQQLGLIYLHIGLFDKAWDEDQKAISINPGDTSSRLRLGLNEEYRTHYDRAYTILKTIPPEANPAIVNRAMAIVLFQLGRTDEAAKVVDEFLSANPDEGGNVTSVKAMLFARAGRADAAEAAIEHAIEIGKGYQHFHHTTYNIACAYALLNKHEEAIKWLQTTADEGFPCYPMFENDHNLDSLRGDEKFIAMMQALERQWESYKAEL